MFEPRAVFQVLLEPLRIGDRVERAANRGHEEARALLELARSLAAASTSEEVTERLAEAVPAVVDCDRVSVWVWDDDARTLGARPQASACR